MERPALILQVPAGSSVEDALRRERPPSVADGAVVETGAMVAAGAVVTPGKRVTSGQLWGGTPARPMRDLTPEEKRYIDNLPDRYFALAQEYR
jgi:carbonic anhydrase/acetyltransferase-like protein (isoleucine patch superfamily)